MGWRLETDTTLEGEPTRDKGVPTKKVDAQLSTAKKAAKVLLQGFGDDARVTLSGYISGKDDPAPDMVAAIVTTPPGEGFAG